MRIKDQLFFFILYALGQVVAPAVVAVIQASWLVTLAYTPGYRASAQRRPQLTTPARSQLRLGPGVTSGPPESPWQASLPPAGTEAQSIWLVMSLAE